MTYNNSTRLNTLEPIENQNTKHLIFFKTEQNIFISFLQGLTFHDIWCSPFKINSSKSQKIETVVDQKVSSNSQETSYQSTFLINKYMSMKEVRKLQNILWILEVNISSRIPLTLVAAKHYFSRNSNSHITKNL